MTERETRGAVRHAATWFDGAGTTLGTLVELAAAADVVLIGEASHGTDEFYRIRADLTRALIQHHGFRIVAAEADWPDAYRANRWVRLASAETDATAALRDFVRFPRWMWRNDAVVDFLQWMRTFNAGLQPDQRAGFYGLDLYSLHSSMEAVLRYLSQVDPEGANRAKERYACFEEFGDNAQDYGYATTLGLSRSCEDDVIGQLVELRRRAFEYAGRNGRVAQEEYFSAEQNARLVRNAEQYYRSMFGNRAESWNLRDTHMVETLHALIDWSRKRDESPKAIVWAHNSHLGDARATQMSSFGEINVGQLVREQHGHAAFLIGFTTHDGTVTAARDWDDPAERRQIRPSLPGSYERLFHDTALERFFLDLRRGEAREALLPSRLERAIGVIYKPATERASHYFRSTLPEQFDAVIHVDRTNALTPLEPWAQSEADLPETWPTGV